MTHRDMLIMVPGVNLDGRLFEAQSSALAPKYDIMIADNRQDDSITLMAKRLLDHAPEQFALAGLSMGGYVALEVMRLASQRVTRLALLDTTARPDTAEARERRERMIVLAEGGLFERTHKMLWDRLVHPNRQQDEKLERKVLDMMQETGAQAFIRQQHAIIGRRDARPMLSSIHVPTLVLVGQQDILTPPELAQEMAEAIPDAHLVTVEACGHLSPLEQPEKVTEALLSWLNSEASNGQYLH